MDFGELGEDVDEEVVVPAGPFQLAPHGAFARFQPAPGSAPVCAAGPGFPAQCPFRFRAWSSLQVTSNTQCSRFSIPNGPARCHCTAPAARPGSAGSNGVSWLASPSFRRVAVTLPTACKPRPVMLLLQPVNVGADAGDAALDASVSLANLGRLRHRRAWVIQEQFHVIVKRTLVAFQCQGRSLRLAPPPAGPPAAGSAWRQQ